MRWSNCKRKIILYCGIIFFLPNCSYSKFNPINNDPYRLRNSVVLKTTFPQDTKDPPYLYLTNITIRGFSPSYSQEEKLYICKALDIIQFLINLDEFKLLLEEILFFEEDPSSKNFSEDTCGILYTIPQLCKTNPYNKSILSIKKFFTSLQKLKKNLEFYKKKFDSDIVIAIGAIGGEEIIWSGTKYSPITSLEMSFVITTLVHELTHSLGYLHSSRIPYAVSKILSRIFVKYEQFCIQHMVGRFQKLCKDTSLSIPHKISPGSEGF